jgi:hypothetical protein
MVNENQRRCDIAVVLRVLIWVLLKALSATNVFVELGADVRGNAVSNCYSWQSAGSCDSPTSKRLLPT